MLFVELLIFLDILNKSVFILHFNYKLPSKDMYFNVNKFILIAKEWPIFIEFNKFFTEPYICQIMAFLRSLIITIIYKCASVAKCGNLVSVHSS